MQGSFHPEDCSMSNLARFLKVLASILVLLSAVSVGRSASAAEKELKRIILLTNGADPFWDAMRAGMLDAERKYNLADVGLRTVMDVNDGTAKGQIDKLRQYANQTDIAAVAVSVTNAQNAGIARAMSD